MRVNLIDLTPSVARAINPTSVPSLKTLVLGGETATRADIVRWVPYVHVLNGIGQAECTVTTTMATMDPAVSGTPGIGRGLCANTWIVDPEDHHRLTAIGAIGELLVEGPLVGEGCLNNGDKTSVSFIRDPHWLVKEPPDDHSLGRSGRLYKTGDLVRYDMDGSLLFMGRKDAQTKIRGQRIELEEVEYHVWRLLQGRSLVNVLAAEVTVPRGASSSILIVFICPIQEKDNSAEIYVMDFRSLPEEFCQLNVQLAKELPPAMIPFAYVPINRIPLAPIGKTDRKKLKFLGTGFTTDELANFDLNPRERRRPPSTAMERHLQHLWAEIFAVSADDIAANDDFLQLCGDSIFAMRLTGLGRKCGLNFTAMDVLSQSRLCDLTKVAQAFTNGTEGMMAEIAPFSMLQTDDITGYLRRKVQPFIESPTEEVQDVFPVTDFQAECIRGALQRPPVFWNYFFVDLDSQIDIARLREVVGLSHNTFLSSERSSSHTTRVSSR